MLYKRLLSFLSLPARFLSLWILRFGALLLLSACGTGRNYSNSNTVSGYSNQTYQHTAGYQTVNMFSKHCPGGGRITVSTQQARSSQYPSPELREGNSATVSGAAPCGTLGLVQFSCQARAVVARGGFACHSGTLSAPARTTALGQPISWFFVEGEGQAQIYNNGQRLGGWIMFRSSQGGSCLVKLDC